MSTSMLREPPRVEEFRHEAFFYSGRREFYAGTMEFIRGALADNAPVLVVLTPAKTQLLQSGLGEDADAVMFADMAQVGRNPARIIPAWREFVSEHAGEGPHPRGIGEPIWPGRSSAELIECQHHEALLNRAFAGSPAWWLLCPYDREALDSAVLERAARTPSPPAARSHPPPQ